MSTRINTRDLADVTVVDDFGPIAAEGTDAVHSALRLLIESGRKKVLLNLSGVTSIDGSGIAELVLGVRTFASAGGTLKLLGLTRRHKQKILAAFARPA